MNDLTFDFVKILNEEKKSQDYDDRIWKDSPLEPIQYLKANNVGSFGEKIINLLCERMEISSNINGNKTKSQNIGDGIINNKSIEIKTARMGKNKTFQHELGEFPWKSDYLLFVDITPENVFIIIMKNFTQEFYLYDRKVLPYFENKILRRKKTGNFKFTLSLKQIQENKDFILKIPLNFDINDDTIRYFFEKNIK